MAQQIYKCSLARTTVVRQGVLKSLRSSSCFFSSSLPDKSIHRNIGFFLSKAKRCGLMSLQIPFFFTERCVKDLLFSNAEIISLNPLSLIMLLPNSNLNGMFSRKVVSDYFWSLLPRWRRVAMCLHASAGRFVLSKLRWTNDLFSAKDSHKRIMSLDSILICDKSKWASTLFFITRSQIEFIAFCWTKHNLELIYGNVISSKA